MSLQAASLKLCSPGYLDRHVSLQAITGMSLQLAQRMWGRRATAKTFWVVTYLTHTVFLLILHSWQWYFKNSNFIRLCLPGIYNFTIACYYWDKVHTLNATHDLSSLHSACCPGLTPWFSDSTLLIPSSLPDSFTFLHNIIPRWFFYPPPYHSNNPTMNTHLSFKS